MDETELDFEDTMNEVEESFEEPEYIIETPDESEDDLWEPPPKKQRRTPRKKVVIPPEAHPIERFMLMYDFQWGEVISMTMLSKETLIGIIRGDAVTDEQRSRLRLTTGVVV